MLIDPYHRPGHVQYLFTPGHRRLQAIIDDRDAYASSRVKTTDIAVGVSAAKFESFVASPPCAAVNKDHDRPAPAFGDKKIQAMLAWVCQRVAPVCQVLIYLLLR